jgi:hypothetical protein
LNLDINNIRVTHGIALSDLLEPLLDHTTPFNLKPDCAAIICDKISNIEARLANGGSEKLQTLALIAAFTTARDLAFRNENLE